MDAVIIAADPRRIIHPNDNGSSLRSMRATIAAPPSVAEISESLAMLDMSASGGLILLFDLGEHFTLFHQVSQPLDPVGAD